MATTRISRLFDALRARRAAGLVAYITAGDPEPGRTASLVEALERGGADLIELGVPFSDPIADGPVIQRASERALAAGTTLRGVLEIARDIRRRSEIPLVLFTYMNPLLRYGLEALARDAVAAGIDGCLLTDLSVEEAAGYTGVMRGAGLDTVFLVAPTSTPRRLALVAEHCSGFVYLVSRTGVTGESERLSDSVEPLVAATRKVTALPLAVGFGVSKPEHAAEIGRLADAVVVGSAFVRLVEQNGASATLEVQLESMAREMKGAMEGGRR